MKRYGAALAAVAIAVLGVLAVAAGATAGASRVAGYPVECTTATSTSYVAFNGTAIYQSSMKTVASWCANGTLVVSASPTTTQQVTCPPASWNFTCTWGGYDVNSVAVAGSSTWSVVRVGAIRVIDANQSPKRYFSLCLQNVLIVNAKLKVTSESHQSWKTLNSTTGYPRCGSSPPTQG